MLYVFAFAFVFLFLQVQSEDSVLLFVIAWTVTEIIRYSFYTFSLLNHLPYLIKWARYTLFIVLYPMGVSGELLTIYAALPFVRQAGLYSISLPNKYNFSFDYYAFLILIMISYIPIFPQLYYHMIHQRRKILSHTEEHKKLNSSCSSTPPETNFPMTKNAADFFSVPNAFPRK
ncbi:Very-long-chain -3-hydroxyacyl-CoA dehydratase 2 [Camelus dromedarius]|uniref:Very-long-chain (3R)-3-hydroxyacyl-CoA dehydratase n=1 Tax=Camelus dromedarius TaxID=9838 RepID=A0A5N4EJD7_CAMDR|nr:Very-long-chain -3-hydroxyacyl-CoA dehydratase 2 [Camelus dromedarius]KAB1283614.1 Very-long-chain -3-hydroxyacyl-CoA dehydratase 2 [Camelus dromedarius]